MRKKWLEWMKKQKQFLQAPHLHSPSLSISPSPSPSPAPEPEQKAIEPKTPIDKAIAEAVKELNGRMEVL